jgi:endonuclease/exonuclease/phosphatase (EEP) superfamily protein YafD
MMLWAAVTLVALGATAAALGRVGWPYEIATSLAPQIGAAALALALGALALNELTPALFAGLAAGMCAVLSRELFAPADPPLEIRQVRAVWANVLGQSAALDRVFRLAEAEGADVVLIAEPPRRLSATELTALAGPFVHHAGRPDMTGVMVAAFAREPIEGPAPIGEATRRPGLTFSLTTGGGTLRVTAVHPHVPWTPRMLRDRDALITTALAHVTHGGPSLLVGDFNTTSWSDTLRAAVVRRLHRASLGPRSTWLTAAPVFGLPIDHAFGGGGVRVAARLGPFVGSDHLPLIVDVAYG